MFGTLPASGFFIRHVKSLEFGNVEIATEKPDSRPAFWLNDVDGADFFRVKTNIGQNAPTFSLKDVKDFRVFGSRAIKDVREDKVDQEGVNSELPALRFKTYCGYADMADPPRLNVLKFSKDDS